MGLLIAVYPQKVSTEGIEEMACSFPIPLYTLCDFAGSYLSGSPAYQQHTLFILPLHIWYHFLLKLVLPSWKQ